MRKKLTAFLLAVFGVALNASAADLLQVYKSALQYDAQFASARASRDAGREKASQGLATLLPTLDASGNYARSNVDVDGSAGADYSSNGYAISLSQPLFRWANYEQYQQGKLAAAASDAELAQAHSDLMVRVAQAYFAVLAAEDAIAFVQAQKKAISEQLASAKRNFEVGTATITDTHEAQARYDLAVAQELAGLNDLAVKRAALQVIIGNTPEVLSILRHDVKIRAPEPMKMGVWVETAQKQNYGVIGSELAFEIAQREVSKSRAGHMPTLDLVASYSHTNQPSISTSFTNSKVDTDSIGIQWNMPLFSGFSVSSQVREAIALKEKARNDLEYSRRSAAQAARQSYLGVTNGLAQVKALEAAQVSSQSALESNKLGYEVGVRINIDVLNAQQQLYSTQKDLAKARYDTIVNGLRLKSAAGTLKDEDIVRINALLQH